MILAVVVPDGCGAEVVEDRKETDGIGIDVVDAGREEGEEEVSECVRENDSEWKASVPLPPPAKSESCANPTEGGLKRKTEYTFFFPMEREQLSSCKSLGREGTTYEESVSDNPRRNAGARVQACPGVKVKDPTKTPLALGVDCTEVEVSITDRPRPQTKAQGDGNRRIASYAYGDDPVTKANEIARADTLTERKESLKLSILSLRTLDLLVDVLHCSSRSCDKRRSRVNCGKCTVSCRDRDG